MNLLMNTNKFMLRLIGCLLFTYHITLADTPITIYTPEGRSVTAYIISSSTPWYTDAMAQEDIDYWSLDAELIETATAYYNCHGYAWAKSENIGTYWIGYVDDDQETKYFSDGAWSNDSQPSYVSSSSAEATHGCYEQYSDHSIRVIQNSYPLASSGSKTHVSKWGSGPLVRHAPGHDVYALKNTSIISYYKLKTTHSGTLSSYPKMWIGAGNKTHTSSNDITIPSGVTLTIKPGATFNVQNGATLIANGTINAIGTPSSRITLTKSGSNNWGGIQFNSGSSGTLDYCNITYATTGINMYNSSPAIKHSTIDNNSGVGIYCDYYSSPILVGNNIRNNSSHGLRCNFYSSPNLTDYGYPGSNVIRNNLNGVYTAYNCNPNLTGYTTYGNSVFDNTNQEVVAYYSSTVNANKVYWGTIFPPPDAEFYASSSTINRNDPLQTNPNPNRRILPSENNYKTPMYSIAGTVGDDLNLAEEKQKEGKYDEAINLFLEVFKKEKENTKGRYALIKIEECFTQAGKKDFLDFSKKELKLLIKEETELYVVLLELETHQMYNMGYKDNAMNNLQTILKKYNYNTEIEKQTLYRIGVFYLDLYNDQANAIKIFDELAAKYPNDELLTYANLVLNEERYNIQGSKNTDQKIATVIKEELANYPNPFNPITKVSFTLATKDNIKLKVYDILGREISVLANGEFEMGKHEIEFNGSNLPSGVYFYNLTTSSNSITKKMLLIK